MNLQALQDRIEIEDLTTRYAHGVDNRDWAAVDACFSADAEILGTTGKGKYSEYGPNLRIVVGKYHTTMHFLGNKLVTIDGDTGHMITYGVAHHLGAGEADMVIGVRYYDDVVRTADGWKIKFRKVKAIWSHKLDETYKDLVPKT